MKNKSKSALVFVLILFALPHVVFSQKLSQRANAVRQDWEKLNKYPNSKEVQMAYIDVFPQNKKIFMEIFEPKDFSQLYADSYQYVGSFIDIAKYHPKKVVDKSIDIGKDLVWEADATGQLQHGIVEFGVKYVEIFVQKTKTLPEIEINHLIKFLADVENHKAYPQYQQLIDSLSAKGEKRLADKLIKARTLRERVKE